MMRDISKTTDCAHLLLKSPSNCATKLSQLLVVHNYFYEEKHSLNQLTSVVFIRIHIRPTRDHNMGGVMLSGGIIIIQLKHCRTIHVYAPCLFQQGTSVRMSLETV